MKKVLTATALMMLAAGMAHAAEHTVMMLNKGESGNMVFEPGRITAAVGDTIRFVPTDKNHNVEGIKGMLPDGVKPFKSKVNEEYILTVGAPGFYGVKCSPHVSMGMVALIKVGENPPNGETSKSVKLPAKARERMKAAFDALARAQ